MMTGPETFAVRYAFLDCELDVDTLTITRGGAPVRLDRRPMQVLLYLIENRARVVSPHELIRAVWRVRALSDSAVPTAIRAIRLALGDDSSRQVVIATIPRHGYRFAPAVSLHQSAPFSTASASPFVGRQAELRVLAESLAAMLARESGVILVAGEAGIGKTRLVEEFARIATGLGSAVLIANARDINGAPSFWPWIQILRRYAASHSVALPPEELGPLNRMFEAVPPENVDDLDGGAALTLAHDARQRFRFFESFQRFLCAAADRQPLVLALEDIHCADTASLLLLNFIARETSQTHLLLLATYRDGELELDPARSALIGDLIRSATTRRVFLQSLSRDDVDEFVKQRFPRSSFAPSLGRRLYEQTGGNPFFLAQLANILETHAVGPGSQLPGLPVGLPAEVKHAVLMQVRTLPDSTIDLLSVAAAVGSEIDCSILDRVASQEPGWALETLGPALSLRLLLTIPDQPNHFRFAHALVREAIYGSTEIGWRLRTHKAIADAIEATHPFRTDAYAGELAHHYRQAHDFQRACAHYALAGDAARERLAFEDAAIFYRAALGANDSLESLPLSARVEILLGLGDVEMRAGERARGRDALQEAAMLSRRIGRPDLLARAALSLAPAFFLLEVGVVDHALIGLLEEALTRLGPEHALLRAQLLARLGVALAYSDEAERSRRLSADAVRIAERSGDASTVAYVLTARHPLFFGPERTNERLKSASRVIQAALATGDRETALVHRLFRLTELLASGAMQLVEVEITAFSQLAQEIDLPQSRWYAVLFRAMRHHMRGELTEAEERANEFLARGQEVGDRNAILSFTAMTTLIRAERGDFPELVPMVDSVRRQFPAIDLAWRCAAAWALSENGDARRALEHVQRVHIDEMPRDVLWLCSLTSLAIGVAWLGDETRAHRLYEALRPYAQLNAVVGYGVACLGSVSRALGMLSAVLGDWSAADDWFLQALVANRRIDSPIWIAHTLHAHARMLGSQGSPSATARAAAMVTEATSIASALGMRSLEARARRLARDLDRRAVIRFSYLA